jgi:hypothetical protein
MMFTGACLAVVMEKFAERDVMERQPVADRSYSALMPAAWITLPHFSA